MIETLVGQTLVHLSKIVFLIDGAEAGVFLVIAGFALTGRIASFVHRLAAHVCHRIIAAVRESVGIFNDTGTECNSSAANPNSTIGDHLCEMTP